VTEKKKRSSLAVVRSVHWTDCVCRGQTKWRSSHSLASKGLQ